MHPQDVPRPRSIWNEGGDKHRPSGEQKIGSGIYQGRLLGEGTCSLAPDHHRLFRASSSTKKDSLDGTDEPELCPSLARRRGKGGRRSGPASWNLERTSLHGCTKWRNEVRS